MELGRYLVEAHLVEGRSVAELAAAPGVLMRFQFLRRARNA